MLLSICASHYNVLAGTNSSTGIESINPPGLTVTVHGIQTAPDVIIECRSKDYFVSSNRLLEYLVIGSSNVNIATVERQGTQFKVNGISPGEAIISVIGKTGDGAVATTTFNVRVEEESNN